MSAYWILAFNQPYKTSRPYLSSLFFLNRAAPRHRRHDCPWTGFTRVWYAAREPDSDYPALAYPCLFFGDAQRRCSASAGRAKPCCPVCCQQPLPALPPPATVTGPLSSAVTRTASWPSSVKDTAFPLDTYSMKNLLFENILSFWKRRRLTAMWWRTCRGRWEAALRGQWLPATNMRRHRTTAGKLRAAAAPAS